MDHWGDPWADNNADQQKSPIQDAVTSPQPPAPAPAPVLAPAPLFLNGFLDDAGWGNEKESFGAWTTPSANDAAVASVEARVPSPSPLRDDENTIPDSGFAWTEPLDDTPDMDNVTSDTLEASTTILPDAAPDQDAKTRAGPLQPDDDSSARPSTSQSKTSRIEAPAELPRTSIEDEGGVGKQIAGEASIVEEATAVGEKEERETHVSGSESDSTEDEFGTSTADTLSTDATPGQNEAAQDESEKSNEDTHKHLPSATEPETESTLTSSAAAVPSSTNAYHLDTTLLDELFPPLKDAKEPDDPPEDPVYSTSGRKAWYRLTREQTMREFNSGNGDDNYIRVTWAGSQVRSEINKTVTRWAREDRISGTGPGARAFFYWDTPAPIESKMPRGHQRTKTSIPIHGPPTQRAAAPMRQSLPPVATNTPAAFNWSLPTSTVDPWKQDSPGLIVSPTIPSPNTDNAQRQELRAVSADLTCGVAGSQGQTTTASTETPAVAKAIPPPVLTTTSTNLWRDSSALDTNYSVQERSTKAPDDDDNDDDWGEMISSPTVSTPISAFPTSLPATRDNTLSTSASTPETPPDRHYSSDAMHAASIVRLKSTISPTSAIFGPKSFVPLHVEQGLIGPGLLKPIKRNAVSTSEKSKSKQPLESAPEPVQSDDVQQNASKALTTDEVSAGEVKALEPAFDEGEDEFSAFESSTLDLTPARPMTPPPPATLKPEPMTDSWADADLSLFESAPSTATTAPLESKHDPLDPFSIFETPPRPTSSAASSAKTFTRSSPRNLTPPAIQPLTGATNSAQRRKNEEEQIIREILAGLPDLSYMLV